MNNLEQMKALVHRHEEMNMAMKLIRKDMAEQAMSLLKEYNIQQIGLWSGDWTDGSEFDSERTPEYNEEDGLMFKNLSPNFKPALWYGGDQGEFEGKIIAIRNNNGKLQFVCASDFYQDVRILDVMDYVSYPEEMNIAFVNVMEALSKSVEFNIQNNIPVSKWDITHYPPFSPYTDEYISYGDERNDFLNFYDD